MRILRSRPWLAGLAAVCLIAAASGAAAQQEIVIGAPNSLTGGFGEPSRRVVVGLEIAVNEINRAGGIRALGGAKLRMIAADTSSDNPSQAASVTRRMIAQDNASVLVGCHTGTMTLAAQVEAEKAGVPIITTSYADQIVERGYKYTFKIPPQASRIQALTVQYVQELYKGARGADLKRIAVFYGTDASSQSLGKAAIAQAQQRGIEIVAEGSFPSGLTDPTPIVAPILQTKPDLAFVLSFTNDIILVTRALRSLDQKLPIVAAGGGIAASVIGEALGQSANGLMGAVVWNWDLPIPGVEEFLKLLKQERPDEPYPPTFESMGQGYAIGHLIKAAIEKAGSADPKKIREALATIEVPAILPGGKIGFDERGLNKYLDPVLVGWVNGQLHTLWPQQYQTAKPPI